MQIFFNILTLLATIISPMLAAYFVYNKWHDQKANEVIANEAKEYMYILNKLQSIQSRLESYNDKYLTRSNIDEYILVKKELSNKSNFLGFALENDNDLNNLMTSYQAYCLIYIQHLEERLIGKETYNKNKVPNGIDALNLNRMLLEYATYKKYKST